MMAASGRMELQKILKHLGDEATDALAVESAFRGARRLPDIQRMIAENEPVGDIN